MRSKLLRKIHLDPVLAEQDAQSILQSEGTDESSEFTYGIWRSYVLWNGTGDLKDTTVREYQGSACCTALAAKVPYLESVLGAVFATEHIKWVRAFQVSDGVLVPHRNLRDSCRSFMRLCFPIRTDPGCLHSENECVFHLRTGEVWHFDDFEVHSACSLSSFARVLICVDFDLPENCFESAFRTGASNDDCLQPCFPRREPVDTQFFEAVYSLGTLINWQNVRDIIQLLIKIHFYRDVEAIMFYDWLIEVAARSRIPKLLQKAIEFKKFCLETRDPHDIFEWHPEPGPLHARIVGP